MISSVKRWKAGEKARKCWERERVTDGRTIAERTVESLYGDGNRNKWSGESLCEVCHFAQPLSFFVTGGAFHCFQLDEQGSIGMNLGINRHPRV
jgi:hypothetical protein